MLVNPRISAGSVRGWATLALMIATAMQAADATIANVALPQLEQSLGGGIWLGTWVMTGYLCASAVMAPLTGSLRRRLGARRLYTAAIALFVVASLLCSLAPSGPAIIAFRVAQGAGGGLIHPLCQAILLDLYPKERHGRMLAVWGATIMIGPILGPVLGGVITDLASWRWIFAINLPLGALAIWGMRDALPVTETNEAVPIDALGTALLICGIGALQLLLERGVGHSWRESPELAAEALVTIIALAALAMRRRVAGASVLRLDAFRDMNFAVAAFYNFVTSALFFTTIVFLPALGEGPLGFDATVAGLTIVPRGIAMMLVMLAMGRLIEAVDYRFLLASGLALMAGALAMMAHIRAERSALWIVISSTIQAAGVGMLFTPLSTVAFSTLPIDRRTDAAGLYSLLRQLGCASGLALMTAILQLREQGHINSLAAKIGTSVIAVPPDLRDGAVLRAYADCFQTMAIATLIVAPVLMLLRPRSRKAVIPETA